MPRLFSQAEPSISIRRRRLDLRAQHNIRSAHAESGCLRKATYDSASVSSHALTSSAAAPAGKRLPAG